MISTNFFAESLMVDVRQAITLLPYFVLSLGILLSVLAAGYRVSKTTLKIISLTVHVPVVIFLLYFLRSPSVELFGGALVIDSMTRLVGAVVASLAFVVSLFSKTFSTDRENSEWLSFLLISVLALSLLPACSDFITFFVVLETASIAGYLLAASDRKRILSLEAGLKYLLTGAFASALLLMGIAQLYGQVGSVDFSAVASFLENTRSPATMVYVSAILIMVAFAYKVGLAPFHMWSPDVYQGGPTALSAFLATATKVSLFAAFAVAFYASGLINLEFIKSGLQALAIASIVVGSLMALVQKQLKRMLAYSGVANAGYASLALIAGTSSLAPMLTFLSLYSLAVIIGFAFAQEATLKDGAQSHADVEIASLSSRSPQISTTSKILFAGSVFSLAGIPPFPGFLAKYQILTNVWFSGNHLGATMILVGSLLGIGYYLKVLVPLFMKAEESGVVINSKPQVSITMVVASISALGLFTVLLGFSRMSQWMELVTIFAR